MPGGIFRTPVGLVDPSCPVDWANPLNRGLAGRWQIIPNSGWRGGSTLRDLARGGVTPNDGTLVNSPTWLGGRRPGGYGALSFNGSSHYVDLGSRLNFPAITYMAWVKASTLANSYNTAFYRSGSGAYTILWIKNNGKLAIYLEPSSYDGTGTYTLSVGAWYHVALSYDSTRGLVGYVNGQADGTGAAGAALSTASAATTIGGTPASGTLYFDGQIDDARIYKIHLTSGEIRAIYAESRRGSPETLRWVSTLSYSFPQVAASGGMIYRRKSRRVSNLLRM